MRPGTRANLRAYQEAQMPTERDERRELRIELMLRDLRLYQVAPKVGCHPSSLGRMLRGRAPMPPEIANRLRRVLAEADA
jgi:hypothetical protein